MKHHNLKVEQLYDWNIVTHIGPDYLMLCGRNTRGEYITPSPFVVFDRKNKEGISSSGKLRVLMNFIPNRNTKTEEEALDFIEKYWTKQKE